MFTPKLDGSRIHVHMPRATRAGPMYTWSLSQKITTEHPLNKIMNIYVQIKQLNSG